MAADLHSQELAAAIMANLVGFTDHRITFIHDTPYVITILSEAEV